jgi:hypothetical protein
MGWLVQALLLVAMSPFGTVQCYANDGGSVSTELTVNGVCLNCISEGLECCGCTECSAEPAQGLSLDGDHQCGCVQSPGRDQSVIGSRIAARAPAPLASPAPPAITTFSVLRVACTATPTPHRTRWRGGPPLPLISLRI